MLLLDTHVHLYQPQDLTHLLDAAHANFKQTARYFGKEKPGFDGVLCLTQTARCLSFEQIVDRICSSNMISNSPSGWKPGITKEKTSVAMSVVTETTNRSHIFLIKGQQIVSAERLEVLSIANHEKITDGMSFNETLRAILESGGIPIIPWGVGKWFGRRGRIVKKSIQANSRGGIFLGDNSVRPKIWNNVTLFTLARENGIDILNGSDSLCFSSEINKAGSFGVVFPDAHIDSCYPAAEIKQLLWNRSLPWKNYGVPESFMTFVINQIKLNLFRISNVRPGFCV